MCLIEHLLEEFPGRHIMRSLQPKVRRILASKHLYAYFLEAFLHDASIGHIVGDDLLHLCAALRTICCLRTTLADIARSIEFRTLATVPEVIELNAFTVKSGNCQLLWHHCISASYASKACRL